MNLDPVKMAEWARARWDPRPPPRPVGGVSQDTRNLNAGDVYVALRGRRHDGHDFVSAARRGGAAGALVARDYVADRADAGWPLLRTDDPLNALWRLAEGYRAGLKIHMTGITGSVGKTTVKDLLAKLLDGAGGAPAASTPGNWNNAIGLPLGLLRIKPGSRFGVFEIGANHPGEIGPLARLLHPDAGIITTVGMAHLEHFGDTAAIAREKAELLRALPAGGIAVLNRDHDHFDTLKAAAPCRVLSVSMRTEAAADYRGAYTAPGPADGGGLRLEFTDPEGTLRHMTAPLAGRHQAANLLLAVVTANALGVEWESMPSALADFRMAPMRWQISRRGGITVVDDAYNANPMSMRAALENFAAGKYGGGRRWLVLGGMLELGPDSDAQHREIGRLAARGPWSGLVTVGSEAATIAEAARASGFPGAAVYECAGAEEAAVFLRATLRPGDAVLLKGSRRFRLETVAQTAWETADGLDGEPEGA